MRHLRLYRTTLSYLSFLVLLLFTSMPKDKEEESETFVSAPCSNPRTIALSNGIADSRKGWWVTRRERL